MKNKLKKPTVTLILIPIFISIIYIILHISPSLAVRTKLFSTWHPIAAFIVGVKYNAFQQSFDVDELNKMNAKIYEITGPEVDFEYTGQIHNFIVKKSGYLYFAYYWGEF